MFGQSAGRAGVNLAHPPSAFIRLGSDLCHHHMSPSHPPPLFVCLDVIFLFFSERERRTEKGNAILDFSLSIYVSLNCACTCYCFIFLPTPLLPGCIQPSCALIGFLRKSDHHVPTNPKLKPDSSNYDSILSPALHVDLKHFGVGCVYAAQCPPNDWQTAL